MPPITQNQLKIRNQNRFIMKNVEICIFMCYNTFIEWER